MAEDELGTVRWFGDSWRAPVCDPRTHVGTPSGVSCIQCQEPIDPDDQGITLPYVAHVDRAWTDGVGQARQAWHLQCWLREVLGDSAQDLLTHNPEVKP